jgi:hypothetical protein
MRFWFRSHIGPVGVALIVLLFAAIGLAAVYQPIAIALTVIATVAISALLLWATLKLFNPATKPPVKAPQQTIQTQQAEWQAKQRAYWRSVVPVATEQPQSWAYRHFVREFQMAVPFMNEMGWRVASSTSTGQLAKKTGDPVILVTWEHPGLKSATAPTVTEDGRWWWDGSQWTPMEGIKSCGNCGAPNQPVNMPCLYCRSTEREA